ncbi:MAG: lysine--tRNA ligase [Firmicutes bacterium]|nr:lysine--tRNA ligase [Bacillota bacterium]
MSEEKNNVMEENLSEVLKVRREKLAKLQEAGRNPFEIEKYDVTAYSVGIKEDYEAYEGKEVSIAGRIMAKRRMGKASFIDIQDRDGRIQVYVRKDEVGDEEYSWFITYDIGDIVGVKGDVFKSKTGEVSIKAHSVLLMSKSLQVLPEKFHGLTDTEIRYRQRYVDTIVNPEVKEVFLKRTQIIKGIREFMDGRGFLEVETPILDTIAGGAAARPFITHHNTLDIDMYMRIANELFLKRLIVGGFDRVYEMGHMFRNEGMDPKHNPEYTAIEMYQAYADYHDMMELTESLVEYLCVKVNGTTKINYQGTDIDFKTPWKRATMVEMVRDYAGVDFDKILTDEEAIAVCKERGIEDAEKMNRGKAIAAFFKEYCEDHLEQPIFITQHPVEISPLAKRNPKDPAMTNRFEAFANGWEIANAFSELNDPIDQKQRFLDQLKEREAGDEEAHMMDEDFVNAIEVGLPPTGGLGVGVDRVIMLLTNQPSIRDIILFPTMKPLDKGGVNAAANARMKAAQAAEAAKVNLDFSKLKIEPLFEDMIDFETFEKSDFRIVKVKDCEAVKKSKKLLKFVLDDGSGEDRVILSGIHEYYEPEELIGKTCVAITNLEPRVMMGIESRGMLISAIHEYDGEEGLNLLMVDDSIPAGAKLY